MEQAKGITSYVITNEHCWLDFSHYHYGNLGLSAISSYWPFKSLSFNQKGDEWRTHS